MESFSKIRKGQIIPSFSLKNLKGETILSSNLLRKKNLIIFFFKNLEDKQSKEYLRLLNGIYDDIRQDAEIFAVSCARQESLKDFSKRMEIKFDILVDSDDVVRCKFTEESFNFLIITDRFLSLYKAYSLLPDKDEIVSSIEFLEKQCPECGVSTWPEELGE
ncbi:MAG: peroxiredoxin family protein [Candidatus Omnitrophica bacterium]|nr:peroxiredoxin family protein [Candidatus Omnitrophota bacterium]